MLLPLSMFKEVVQKASLADWLSIPTSLSPSSVSLSLTQAVSPGGHTICPAEEAGAGARAGGSAQVAKAAAFCI